VPPSAIKVLSDRLKLQKGIEVSHKEIEGADHFFTNFEEEMTNAVNEYLTTRSDF
jgi:alpha/beta superfamily hydrolase